MKSILEIFPRASESFLKENPQQTAIVSIKSESTGILKRKRGKMTGVEQEFGLMLESQKRKGEILRYEFQGMTLRWGVDEKTGDSMKYTPDFVVFVLDKWSDSEQSKDQWHIKLIEVKGPYVHYRQQAIARFKGCRSDWPEFQFEMWQKQKSGNIVEGGWKQIL